MRFTLEIAAPGVICPEGAARAARLNLKGGEILLSSEVPLAPGNFHLPGYTPSTEIVGVWEDHSFSRVSLERIRTVLPPEIKNLDFDQDEVVDRMFWFEVKEGLRQDPRFCPNPSVSPVVYAKPITLSTKSGKPVIVAVGKNNCWYPVKLSPAGYLDWKDDVPSAAGALHCDIEFSRLYEKAREWGYFLSVRRREFTLTEHKFVKTR